MNRYEALRFLEDRAREGIYMSALSPLGNDAGQEKITQAVEILKRVLGFKMRGQ